MEKYNKIEEVDNKESIKIMVDKHIFEKHKEDLKNVLNDIKTIIRDLGKSNMVDKSKLEELLEKYRK